MIEIIVRSDDDSVIVRSEALIPLIRRWPRESIPPISRNDNHSAPINRLWFTQVRTCPTRNKQRLPAD